MEFQQRARDFRGGALQSLFCSEQEVGVASRGDDIFADNGFRDACGFGFAHVEGACNVGHGANGIGLFDICFGSSGHIVASEGGKHRLVAFGKNGTPTRMAGEHASAADDAHRRCGANDESVAAKHAQRLVEAYLRCGLLVLLELGVAIHEQHAPEHLFGAVGDAHRGADSSALLAFSQSKYVSSQTEAVAGVRGIERRDEIAGAHVVAAHIGEIHGYAMA